MSYIGDFNPGDVFDTQFCTVTSSGAPDTFTTSPAVVIYKDNSTASTTTGITLTTNFNSVTGLNNLHIDTSTSAGFYASGHNFHCVISAGQAGGVTLSGYVLAEFSIQNRSSLRPATAGRTLAVDASGRVDVGEILGTASQGAAGYVGVDWSKVTNPTTTVGLTNTTIAVTQQVDVNTIKTNPVANAGTVTFPTNATLASTTNLTAGTITTVSGNVNGSVNSVTSRVTANTDQWAGGAIPAPNVTGVPLVDDKYLLGTIYSTPATAGIMDVNVKNIKNATTVGAAGYVGIDWAQIANPTTTVSLTNTTISGGGIPTTASIATAVWQDATAGDFTTAGSIGKSLYTSGNVPGAANGLFIAGTNAATSVNITGNITGNLVGTVSTLTTYTGNTPQTGDVYNALVTTSYAEPAQGAPPATATFLQKLGYLYKAWRNKSDQTATLYQLYADDTTTVDQKATVSDDGTTFTRNEVGTGP